MKTTRNQYRAYSILKKIRAVILIALIVFSVIPVTRVNAENPVFVRIRVNGEWKMDLTDSISTLNSYINKNKDKTIQLDMLTDWNAAAAGRRDDFNETLVIPSGAHITLNMHGYVFNRDNGWRGDSGYFGEMIRVESGATLTINGSSSDEEKRIEHKNVAVFTSTAEGSKATGRITTTGGTITGGVCTRGAGGIYVKTNSTVVLNDVTIAGCCSRDTAFINNGYGGAIWLTGEDCRLTLNNSLITGCMADDYGGAISVNEDTFLIELNNTIIEKNYATNKGGGIYLGGTAIHVNGTGETYIRNNHSGGNGGGIYLKNKNESLSGLTISENKAVNGAGIYMEGGKGSLDILDSAQVLTDLVIKENTASERGGGIYLKGKVVTLSSCEITDNIARMSGGGIYVNENVDKDFNVKGATIIRNNDGVQKGDNLYISDDTPENTRVMFGLNKGAEVWMSYYNLGDRTKVMVTEGSHGDQKKSPNCIQYLHADNQGFHFAFNSEPNSRKIYYVKDDHDSSQSGEPIAPVIASTEITPDKAINQGKQVEDHGGEAGIVGTVGPGGNAGNQYNLIRGFTRHQETDSDTNDASVAFYYSDAFFDDTCDPAIYNEHLATASINMAYAGMYLRATEPGDDNGNYYYNRHGGARQFMADIGCPDQNIYVNDSNEHKPGTDTIGVTIASKQLADANGIKTGKILIPIVTRGGGYELEWASNGTLKTASEMQEEGKQLEAAGFSNAADQVVDEVEKYIEKYDLQDEIDRGEVKFWIAGYSRGGATANITAKRLIEKYADGTEGKNNQVFAYTCEAPMGGSDEAEILTDKTKYYTIHNMINAVDVVPLVAPGLMGFKRYGVDHYIPGTPSGNVIETQETVTRTGIGSTTRTTYRDNEMIFVKQLETVAPGLNGEMLSQLKLVESGIIFDDYFHPSAMDLIPPHTYEDGNYNNNHIEMMIRDFLRFAQEGISPDESERWSQAIPDRNYFANNLQPAIRDMLAMVFAMSPESMTGFSNRAGTIADRIPLVDAGSINMAQIYEGVFHNFGWHNLSKETKQYFITSLWDKFKETGALEYLSKEDAKKLEKHWATLLDFALSFAEADWNYKPGPVSSWAGGAKETMMLIGSFASYSNYILQNHYPEVNLAWARAYDSYYESENKEYRTLYKEEASSKGYSVAIPSAKGKAHDDSDIVLLEGSSNSNILSGDQTIILENEYIVGEAVYYDLIDNSSGKEHTNNLLYRGGIDLSLGTQINKSYTIKTYDISYGVRSEKATYNINLVNDKHRVIVQDGSIYPAQYYLYKEGDKVVLTAAPVADEFFTGWNIRVLDKEGETIATNIAEELLGSSAYKESASFVMPETDSYIYGDSGDKYPEAYVLEIIAKCEKRIKTVTTSLPAPSSDAQQPFKTETELSFDTNVSGTYPVVWTYKYNEETYPATDTVYKDVEYMATIVIPKDQANKVVFVDDLQAIYEGDATKIKENGISISRNDSDGSTTLIIAFKKTEEGDTPLQADIVLDIIGYDRNLNQEISGVEIKNHTLQGSTITITAPDVDNELFNSWDLMETETGISLASGYTVSDKTIKVNIPTGLTTDLLKIHAQYIPVINEISANTKTPKGGEAIQTIPTDVSEKETLKVTIVNTYIIHPDNVKITWTPDPLDGGDSKKIADYLTAYTVTISIKPKEGESVIWAKTGDSGYTAISAVFLYSEELKVKVNGNDAACDKTNNSISYTFPMTKYLFNKVEQSPDINGLAHETSDEEIKDMMPSTATVVTKEGKKITMALDPDPGKWNINEFVPPEDPRGSRVLMVSRVIDMPEGVENPSDKPHELNIRVTVNEADTASSPEATLKSGTYLYDQQTELINNEEGGVVYYAFGSYEKYTEYGGGSIDIKRDNPYVVDEKIIDEHGQEVTTGRKILYLKTYTRRSGKWDSTDVTYEYIFSNEIPVPENTILDYTAMEQIGVAGSPFYMIEEVSEGGRINEDGDAVATDSGEYNARLKIKEGFKWKLSEGSTTTYDQIVTFTIKDAPLIECTITYDLNEGWQKITETYSRGTVISIREAPTKDGYTFLYWQGSIYYPGDPYTVKEDHAFTAVWKRNEPVPPHVPPRTGD